MKPLTNQEIFDIAATGMIEQGARSQTCSVDEHVEGYCRGIHACVYHEPVTDRHCAIGFVFAAQEIDVLNSDELNHEALSSICPDRYSAAHMALFADLDFEAYEIRKDLLASLQCIHDEAPVDRWRQRLTSLGDSYRFELTKLEAASKIPETREGA